MISTFLVVHVYHTVTGVYGVASEFHIQAVAAAVAALELQSHDVSSIPGI